MTPIHRLASPWSCDAEKSSCSTGLSVIIPSKSDSNLYACIDAVRRFDPLVRVIVIDDGLALSLVGPEVRFIRGDKPFVYSRNVNLGIQAAGRDDVILLNDDALLRTPGGLSLLQNAARENPELGLVASTCNNVGNPAQWPQDVGLREDPRMVCFVCVLIPRRTIDKVGLLDERYTGYGVEDDDYSLRVRNAGLKIGIHDGCYVDHGSLTSSYRGGPGSGGDYRPNLQRFIQKWGVDNWGNPA